MSEKLLKASWGSCCSVTFTHPNVDKEFLKFGIFSSEKSLDCTLTGLDTVLDKLIKLRTGKWSDSCDIKIIVSNIPDTWLVIIWSMIVAELGVHCTSSRLSYYLEKPIGKKVNQQIQWSSEKNCIFYSQYSCPRIWKLGKIF